MAVIYMLYSEKSDICYIGSTMRDVRVRAFEHYIAAHYGGYMPVRKFCRSSRVFQHGAKHVRLGVLEFLNTRSQKELQERESYHIETFHCANRYVSTVPTIIRKDPAKVYPRATVIREIPCDFCEWMELGFVPAAGQQRRLPSRIYQTAIGSYHRHKALRANGDF